MSEKLENRIKEGNLTWASYLAPLAQQGSPAHHRRRPPGASRPGVWPTRAHGQSATPPARLPASPASATPRCLSSAPPRPPWPIHFSSLPRGRPNEPECADEHHRSHRAPLAFPCCPAAPSRRPRPLSRVRQRQTACITPCTLDFAASAPRLPATSRRRQPVPDRAVCFYVTAVSSATFPPFSFSLSSSVATARSSPARAAAELVAGATPATPRPRHPHGWMRTSVRIP